LKRNLFIKNLKYVNISLNVPITYLRALEVAELKEEDMPMV
jgi:hypothetical protein